MNEFIIEKELENVKSKITKECLKEVISSYNNENYRSAVVMLYSTVIVDILNKLKELSEIYNDNSAKEILKEIKEKQQQNPKSPNWEKELLKLIENKTHLLNTIESVKVNHLIDDRNLSAHPICNNEYVLISPNRDQVRAHIRNMFEIIFTREALLCKNMTEEFLIDISEYYDKIGDVNNFENYINSKYYSRLNDVIKENLFKTLWKLTFILDNEECNKNRLINYYALVYLVKNNTDKFSEVICKNRAYYSNLKKSNLSCDYDDKYLKVDKTPIVALIFFLAQYDKFYELLNEHAKIIIKSEVDKNINLEIMAYYMSNEMIEHIDKIKIKHRNYYCTPKWTFVEKYVSLNMDIIYKIYLIAKESFVGNHVKQFVIDYVTNADSYVSAEYLLESFMRLFINELDIDEFKVLFSKMDSNNQIYELREISQICRRIKSVAEFNFANSIEYKVYENLKFDN